MLKRFGGPAPTQAPEPARMAGPAPARAVNA
jgi:hypothetical protein